MGDSEQDGLAIARQRIAREQEEQTGYLDLGMLGLTELPEELLQLQHLRALNLGRPSGEEDIAWQKNRTGYSQSEIVGVLLPSGEILPCRAGGLNIPTVFYTNNQDGVDYISPNSFNSLEKLAHLAALEHLGLRGCILPTLNGLSDLNSIIALDCSETNIRDLSPLEYLYSLQAIDLSLTNIDNLGALSRLQNIRYLWADFTHISDISPLSELRLLYSISFSSTSVKDISTLSRLSLLHEIYGHATQIHNLTPLSQLYQLEVIAAGGTHVHDISSLSNLHNVRIIDLRASQVTNINPLSNMPRLTTLNLSSCNLDSFPHEVLNKPSLQVLHLHASRISGIPDGVLSQDLYHNCLDSLRAHFADLDAGAATITDVKLMVLGNGWVGKTQLCRWLRGEPYDDTVPSTHGVLVTSAELPGAAETRLNIWDFGAQDIYHGTHALFLRTCALFLLAWTPELESTGTFVVDGIRFRNHPLAYWVDYVRHQAGADSPVIVAQTRCDKPEDDAPCPVPEADLFKAFKFRKIRQFSAKKRRGTESIAESLREGVAWLREHDNQAVIGAGRYRVQQRLQQMLDADAALPPAHRQHRKLTQDEFRQLCEEAGGISSREHLLSYLHNASTVFYREGLFGNDIILDQGWALDAIYAVFHREKSYKRILARQGRFTRADLEDWAWQEHSDEEQKLFLSMMQSCGICFEHRRLGSSSDGEIEYIAPTCCPSAPTLSTGWCRCGSRTRRRKPPRSATRCCTQG